MGVKPFPFPNCSSLVTLTLTENNTGNNLLRASCLLSCSCYVSLVFINFFQFSCTFGFVPMQGAQLQKHIDATLGSGNLREAVRLPPGEDLNEWLAINSKQLLEILIASTVMSKIQQ